MTSGDDSIRLFEDIYDDRLAMGGIGTLGYAPVNIRLATCRLEIAALYEIAASICVATTHLEHLCYDNVTTSTPRGGQRCRTVGHARQTQMRMDTDQESWTKTMHLDEDDDTTWPRRRCRTTTDDKTL
ncbi:hypothetical protein BDZ89DRAFT_1152489 [Hymenopellis radicata]|nr:hypothetical protein BDZ89DRAFT_1152489 [Hymenopellis radicata]